MDAIAGAAGPVASDTTVLVYALDPTEAVRQEIALATIATLAMRGDWLLPAQVLAELANVALRKLALDPETVREVLRGHRRAAQRVIPLTPPVIDEALRGVATHGLSYYDAQVWAAARLAGAVTLLTEDFQSGRDLDGVLIVNPFDV